MGRSLRTTAYVLVAAACCAPAARAQAPAPTPVPTPAAESAPATAVPRVLAGRGRAARLRPGLRRRRRVARRARCCGCAARRSRRPTRSCSWARPVMPTTSSPRRSCGARRPTDVRVPMGAVTGPVAVVDRSGALTAPSVAPLTVEPAPPTGIVEFGVTRARASSTTRRMPATLTYVVHGAAPVPVTVDLARSEDGAVVAHWDLGAVAPEVPQQRHLERARQPARSSAPGATSSVSSAGGVAQPPVAVRLRPRPLPDPRQVHVRHRRRGVRRRPRAPGPRRVRRLRHAAGGRARRRRQVRAATTPAPATTS